MNGPPAGYPPGPPAYRPPPLPTGGPEPVPPRRGGLTKVVFAAAVVFVVCVGLGVGLAVGSRGDDSSGDEAASATTTTAAQEQDESDSAGSDDPSPSDDEGDDGAIIPFDPSNPPDDGSSLDDLLDNLPEGWEELLPDDLRDQLSDLEDLGDLGDLEIPGVDDIQVSVVFKPDARPRREQAIRDAFEASDLMSFVQFLSAEDLGDFTGQDLPDAFGFDVLSAFGRNGADPDETRDFACSFADDPSVEIVQVFGADPCGQTF